MSTGGGQKHLNEVLAAINVPSMTKKSFICIEKNQVGASWGKIVANEIMNPTESNNCCIFLGLSM